MMTLAAKNHWPVAGEVVQVAKDGDGLLRQRTKCAAPFIFSRRSRFIRLAGTVHRLLPNLFFKGPEVDASGRTTPDKKKALEL